MAKQQLQERAGGGGGNLKPSHLAFFERRALVLTSTSTGLIF